MRRRVREVQLESGLPPGLAEFVPSAWPGACVHEQRNRYRDAMREWVSQHREPEVGRAAVLALYRATMVRDESCTHARRLRDTLRA